jgi:hypothetical protein
MTLGHGNGEPMSEDHAERVARLESQVATHDRFFRGDAEVVGVFGRLDRVNTRLDSMGSTLERIEGSIEGFASRERSAFSSVAYALAGALGAVILLLVGHFLSIE